MYIYVYIYIRTLEVSIYIHTLYLFPTGIRRGALLLGRAIYTYMYIHLSICMYAYIYVYICIYIYCTYAYMYTLCILAPVGIRRGPLLLRRAIHIYTNI